MSGSAGRTPLILGIGNLLMRDEGVGVHAAQRLAAESLPAGVVVVDGGTGGFHLLSLFADHDPVILIDATIDGNPPGTVRELHPRFASDFPRTLSAHDIGLRDLVETAALSDHLPAIHLITVSIDTLQEMSVELSSPVRAALPEVMERAKDLVAALNVTRPSAAASLEYSAPS